MVINTDRQNDGVKLNNYFSNKSHSRAANISVKIRSNAEKVLTMGADSSILTTTDDNIKFYSDAALPKPIAKNRQRI